MCGSVGGGDCGEHSPICPLVPGGKGLTAMPSPFLIFGDLSLLFLYLFSALNFYTLLLCPPQAVSMLLHVSSLCLSMSS